MPVRGNIDNVSAVILAAGASSRYGSPKQLASFNNRPFITHVLATATELVDAARVVVVTGACHEAISAVISTTAARIVYNEHWQDGMAGSIRTAIMNLPQDTGAVLLMTCDQVLISTAQYRQLIDAWLAQPESTVASRYAGTIGVPAVFPQHMFAALCRLQGDSGARKILQDHGHEMQHVTIDEAQYDIDTVEDMINAGLLERLQE